MTTAKMRDITDSTLCPWLSKQVLLRQKGTVLTRLRIGDNRPMYSYLILRGMHLYCNRYSLPLILLVECLSLGDINKRCFTKNYKTIQTATHWVLT